ncbi:peptide deformylase 1B, chloroplastic/mitochondrial isoform X2 [Amborella trichopoda]|uniref:Peptide deformylase n=1 Tax=Amborella trichopoda TaxID=13333 RepID=W1NXQ8_AMBTC|nr:peptide deformylase 1B, chloroplastic/mitochondrial isoform X2 [Amborella trichopoda]ERN02397.1 hypothetical protein AMTR_s00096p00105910 [Amborella trichopoda]|eukprot:XP_006840722.1 peptide deformylase 1B, chloroplastic/mitochondrial isoform X2 [Amborella trichopoda]
MACALRLQASPFLRTLLSFLCPTPKPHTCYRLNRNPNFSLLLRTRSTFATPMTPVMQARREFCLEEDGIATPADLSYEAPLKIVEYPDPRLRVRNKRVSVFDENLKELVAEMFDVMYKTDGIGLSAPQVGINVQLMVFNPAGERGEGEELVLINPKVYKYSKKLVLFDEGCLSFPGIYADVERPTSVKIDARDITGAKFSVHLKGLPARVFQHEFDHLQGILFFERMTEEVLESIRPGLQALEKKYETLTGLPSPESITKRQGIKAIAGFGAP